MSDSGEALVESENDHGLRRDVLRYALQLALLTCAGFSAVGSLVLIVRLGVNGFSEDGLLFGLALKAVLFWVIVCAAVIWAVKSPKSALVASKGTGESSGPAPRILTVGVFLLVLLSAYPLLHKYPWTAPDELYHLVVARNLGVHHAYASGNPVVGFNYFDHYDSVGVTVLAPIALAFKAVSVSISTARFIIATTFVLLALGVFTFVRRHWGARSACVSVVMLTLSSGSVYLGRSLYGEVPALMFFVWCMVCWDRTLQGNRTNVWGFATGLLWGCAVLAKSFMLLSAFPILAVWGLDRLTHMNISLKGVLLPAAGAIFVLGFWTGITTYYSYLKTGDVSMIVYYRHYLMFGLEAAGHGFSWFAQQPVYSAGMLFSVVWLLSRGIVQSPSPAVWVLFMTAVLYLFWWLFYTPATLSRYLWYTYAIAGMFMGPALIEVVSRLRKPDSPSRLRVALAVVALCMLYPAGARLLKLGDLIYVQDQAGDERALAAYVESLPAETRIGTAYYPAILSMDFMTGRNLDMVDVQTESDVEYDVIIYDQYLNATTVELMDDAQRFGRYVVVLRNDREREIRVE